MVGGQPQGDATLQRAARPPRASNSETDEVEPKAATHIRCTEFAAPDPLLADLVSLQRELVNDAAR